MGNALRHRVLSRLLRDKVALGSAVVLTVLVLACIVGRLALDGVSQDQHLRAIGLRPFSGHGGWAMILGSDELGRSVLARALVGGMTTLEIAVPSVVIAAVLGSVIGLWAGFHGNFRETFVLRVVDVILSFPSLLLALVVLYVFGSKDINVILVLSLTGLPLYIRTARASAAEMKSRLYVDAARTFGVSNSRIIVRHLSPVVGPTIATVAVLNFSTVMLASASLSFLGLGVQPPAVDLGLMVSEGEDYLQTYWWIAVVPGVLIVLLAVCSALLVSWLRVVLDPDQRWRFVNRGAAARDRRRAAVARSAGGVTAPLATSLVAGSDHGDPDARLEVGDE